MSLERTVVEKSTNTNDRFWPKAARHSCEISCDRKAAIDESGHSAFHEQYFIKIANN